MYTLNTAEFLLNWDFKGFLYLFEIYSKVKNLEFSLLGFAKCVPLYNQSLHVFL